MGCCGSRHGEVIKIDREKLKPFITTQAYDALTCKQIKSLKLAIMDKAAYSAYSKEKNVPVPFELVEIYGKVFPLELKICLLLVSKDSNDEKIKLFKRLVKNDRQRLRFYEWRYQLTNERIPNLMAKKKELDETEREVWLNCYRIAAGAEIKSAWTDLHKEGFEPGPEILSIN